jgi:hypothetical protein
MAKSLGPIQIDPDFATLPDGTLYSAPFNSFSDDVVANLRAAGHYGPGTQSPRKAPDNPGPYAPSPIGGIRYVGRGQPAAPSANPPKKPTAKKPSPKSAAEKATKLIPTRGGLIGVVKPTPEQVKNYMKENTPQTSSGSGAQPQAPVTQPAAPADPSAPLQEMPANQRQAQAKEFNKIKNRIKALQESGLPYETARATAVSEFQQRTGGQMPVPNPSPYPVTMGGGAPSPRSADAKEFQRQWLLKRALKSFPAHKQLEAMGLSGRFTPDEMQGPMSAEPRRALYASIGKPVPAGQPGAEAPEAAMAPSFPDWLAKRQATSRAKQNADAQSMDTSNAFFSGI